MGLAVKTPRNISAIMNSIAWAQKIVDRKLPLLPEDDPGATDRQWLREVAFRVTLKELLHGNYIGTINELDP
jgi:hypothetical protein